jgi:hypothetical protein
MNVLIRKKTKKEVNRKIVFAERYIWTYLQALLEEANFTYDVLKTPDSDTGLGLKSLEACCDGLSLKASLSLEEVLVLDCRAYIIDLTFKLNFNDRITLLHGQYSTGDFTVFFQSFGNTLLECSRSSIDETSIGYGDHSSSLDSWSIRVSKG